MASVRNRVVCSLRDLQVLIQWWEFPSQSVSDICNGISDQIEAILLEFRFLTLFEDCIHKWIDAQAVVSHLGSLAIRIEAAIQEISNQLVGDEFRNFRLELKEIEEECPSFEQRASKFLDLFVNFEEEINLLKPEIRKACENFSAQPFRCHSPMRSPEDEDIVSWDSFDWNSLVSSLLSCLVIVEDKYCSDHCGRKQIQDLYQKLHNLESFLLGLPRIPITKDFSILIANVAIHAALVSCHWWSTQFDPNVKEDVSIAFADLQRKSDFTDPESLDQILRLLMTLESPNNSRIKKRLKSIDWSVPRSTTDQKVTSFVRYLLPFNRRFENFTGKGFSLNKHLRPFVFIEELESLAISVVKISEEDAEIEQSFLLEFKQLILEIEESLRSSLQENETLLLSLLAKIWLMRLDVFIFNQLTDTHIHAFNMLNNTYAAVPWEEKIKESPNEHTEDVHQILTLVKEVDTVAASVGFSHAKDIRRTVLLLLVVRILHFKLDRKLTNKESIMFVSNNRVKSILEGMKFLINCCINQQGGIANDGVLEVARIEVLARRVASLYQSLHAHNISEVTVEKINFILSDLQDEIKLIMGKLRGIYIHVPGSNFPKTNALGFFGSLLRKLRELLNCKADLFAFVKQHIEEIFGHLKFFSKFLGDILEPEKEIQELRDLGGHLIDGAYEVEYLLDSIVAGVNPECHYSLWLYHLLPKLRSMKKQVTKSHERKINDVKVHNVPQILTQVVSRTSVPRVDYSTLNLCDQQEEIINRLMGGYAQRSTVSIVGMPGIGKTTLAKIVYSSPTVVHHFHIRAWCCITEVYRKRELLLEILGHIIVLTDKLCGMSDEDLELKLRQLLLKRRYLIVLDDMWSTEAWYNLQSSFPDDENGSRILITSRLNHMALNVKPPSDAYCLRFLRDFESWDLLQMKIFHKERCPEELIKVGQEIAKNCKGLPLAVVAVAGLLKRTERQQSQWKEIAGSLNSRIVNNPQEQCRDILELSYKLLPDHLKACFLYFAAFLEDQEIPVRKLIQLWIAEGFVQKTEFKSLEDVAEDYLKDLIDRSLVLFAQSKSRGGTKACRVHDLLRSLCQSKAKEDSFLQVISSSTESDASSDDSNFFADVDLSNSSNYKIYDDHRLCFYSKRNHFVDSRPSGPYVRTLLFFGTKDRYARSSYDISFISGNFRLLKVLELENINMGPSFPSGIGLMVHLRYVAVSGDFDFVPSSIAKLSNLETLVVKGLKGKVNIPRAIWSLKMLRHVRINDVAVFINLEDDKLGNSSILDCLVTLSSAFLPCGENTNNMLRKFPNLLKLGCIFSDSPNCSTFHSQFPRLDFLTRLESLKISYYSRALHITEFSFPMGLKKLTLSNFRLPWSHISVIGRLQNLEVLKLLSRAYDGETWNMVEGEFYNLRFLKLDSLNIAKWNASSDNLPNLEKLVLRNCKYLEEVPCCFVEISTLQTIEVLWCGKYAEESARRMKEEADECLKVTITSDLDSR